jgi:putative aldouronate transport system substrate-binding protein
MRKCIAILLVLLFALAGAWAAGAKDKKATAAREITVWRELNETVALTSSNLADIPLNKELEKRTGVKVTFIHPALGQATEQFNLLVASNELPDMIYWNWSKYPGGPEKAIGDEVIVKLNDLIKNHAPNISRRFKEIPKLEKAIKTDTGSLYCFPFAQSDPGLLVWMGPALRKDWLDELNLSVPETIDEWYTTLKGLQKKVEHPLIFTGPGKNIRDVEYTSAFIGAYGIMMKWYMEDGKVKYGAYQPAYKDFLTTFSKWYAEGLIDPEFMTNDRKAMDSKMLNDRAAAFVGAGGSNVGKYLDAMEEKGTPFDLVGGKYPVLKKGQKPFSGQTDLLYDGIGNAITTQARDPALCTEWSDYAYGDEGYMLFNFGIEGESFNWVEGYPKYSDLIHNHPDGLGMAQALGQYIYAVNSGPILVDYRYLDQYYRRPQQRDAWKKWQQTQALDHKIPMITPTPEESESLAAIMTEINTYVDEMFVRFVTGKEPLANFDQFRAQLKKMGLEKAIAIQQGALDRYFAR